jgi:hypothetical protein
MEERRRVRIHRNMEKLKTEDHCQDRHHWAYWRPAVECGWYCSGWLGELKVRIVRPFEFVGVSIGSFDPV